MPGTLKVKVGGVWVPVPKGERGDKGDKGDQGNPGPANSLAVGTVSTGATGTAASATITGTSPSQTLNLTLPRGEKGDKGDQGPPGIGNVTRVMHDGTSYPARPAGGIYIEWVGPTDPAAQSGLSVTANDTWVPTA